ncbi:hypothetical protein ACILE8_07865 [Capnocytophaga canimorsus]|uniref:hypothetical protein n=1 Tax=Capnocytophaga canimorsus TaxID=28188 RepID=UPI0037D0FA66
MLVFNSKKSRNRNFIPYKIEEVLHSRGTMNVPPPHRLTYSALLNEIFQFSNNRIKLTLFIFPKINEKKREYFTYLVVCGTGIASQYKIENLTPMQREH